MYVLLETPAGYGLFRVTNEKKLKSPENLHKEFENIEKAKEIVNLVSFYKFDSTVEALEAATSSIESKVGKGLKEFLKEGIKKYDLGSHSLGVVDNKLGGAIGKKLKIKCVNDEGVNELTRALRGCLTSLIDGLEAEDLNAMTLGLAHSLSRYKLKFSPDKVDTMIVQAIGLLDDLDKELNNYIMRVREWYGLHFPELGKIVTDNMLYVRLVNKVGFSHQIQHADLEEILPEHLIEEVREASIITMGSSISDSDMVHIRHLCDQVENLSSYRETLFNYVKNRMNAIAPNLSVLVGELVGARLISHAGSLMNLAKHPASTVQILGAEKALFRALKTKHDTPKYGLLYHASIVGQASNKNKGKISRMLANKSSLSVRVDALGEGEGPSIGLEDRAKLEARLRSIEDGDMYKMSGKTKARESQKKYDGSRSASSVYNTSSDFSIKSSSVKDVSMDDDKSEKSKKDKKDKKDKKEKKDKKDKKEKKDRKRKREDDDEGEKKKKKKKKE